MRFLTAMLATSSSLSLRAIELLKKYLSSKIPPRRVHVFVGGDPGDRGLVHADVFGDVPKDQRLK